MELTLGLEMNGGSGSGDGRVVPTNVLTTDSTPIENLITDDTGEFITEDT